MLCMDRCSSWRRMRLAWCFGRMPEFSLLHFLDNLFRTEGVSKSGEWVCNKWGKTNKRADGGQISSTTLADALVITMKKNTSDCNLRGVVLHHLSYVSVKGWRICIIGLSGLSCGTYLSVLSIVRCATHCAGVCWKPICSKQLQKQIEKLALWTKQQKNTTGDGIAKQYINLDILSGTSVSCCERLFSVAKFILADTRKSMSSSVFESILLLNVDWHELCWRR